MHGAERNDICYHCAFTTQIDEYRAQQSRNHLYMDSNNPQAASFVPGLDVDVEYGCTITSKVILDVLNYKNPGYKLRLLHTIGQFNIFSGTDDKTGAEEFWKKLLPQPLSMRTLRLSDACRRCEHCKPQEEPVEEPTEQV